MRLRVSDLVSQYRLEPNLRDLYVEGSEDRRFFEWLLRELCPGNHAKVYDMSRVEDARLLCQEHRIRPSVQGDLVALAVELGRRMPSEAKVTCLADAEYDYTLRQTRDTLALIYTDGAGLELYAYDQEVLQKFFDVCLGGFRYSAADILTAIERPLVERHLIRATNEKLGWGMEWVDSLGSLKSDGCNCAFDTGEFVRTYLAKNGRQAAIKEFHAALDELRDITRADDVRRCIRPHDLPVVLTHLIKPYLRKEAKVFAQPEAARRALLGCLEPQKLASFPAIAQLRSRVCGA